MGWKQSQIRTIVEAAQAMLAGTLSYIVGARKIVVAWRASELDERDADFVPFIAIESETDALPFGELRTFWQTAALEALQPEIDRSEAWARKVGEPHCLNLVK